MKYLLYSFILIAGFIGLGWLLEQQMMYPATKYPKGNWNPPALGDWIHDVKITSEDGVKLHGWWAPRQDTDRTLIWYHGNGGNLSFRIQGVKMLYQLGIQVLILDYRGYGKSDGTPSEHGLYNDGLAAYKFVRNEQNVPPDQLFLFGRSLGSAVATKIAVQKPEAGVILVSSFTSIADMAQHMFPLPFVQYLTWTDYDSETRIKEIEAPLLMLHGSRDQIVPLELGKKLFQQANEPKNFVLLEGAGHNDIESVSGQTYLEAIDTFVEHHSNRK